MDLLIAVACFYCAYALIAPMVKSPPASFEMPQFLSIVLAALLVVVGIYRGIMYFKEYKAFQEEKKRLKLEKEQLEAQHREEQLAALHKLTEKSNPPPEGPQQGA